MANRLLSESLFSKLSTEGGFSASVRGTSPKSGFMVSLPGHETQVPKSEITPRHIEKFADEHSANLGRDKYLGGWAGEKEVSLDVSQNIRPSSKVRKEYGSKVAHAEARDRAMTLGEARNQEAIWDVSAGREIANPHFDPRGRRNA